MRALVVGGGGREHALAWGLARSPSVEDLIVAPGNAGISEVAECVPLGVDDLGAIADLAEERDVDLVVVGPEAPLVEGLADLLRSRDRAVFGPGRDAARIEGSKAWAKDLMVRGGIPTASSGTFSALAPAMEFVDQLGGRAVVKADGLAAGKGVTVARDSEAADAMLRLCIEAGAFGEAGSKVIVEEVLEGPEVSAFVLCDGTTVTPLSMSQDSKRVGDGDTGPNTGGMGAYSPLPFVDAGVEAEIWAVAEGTVAAMKAEGIEYRGLLYVGLMLTREGPKVLEYNCRFGDPETQVVVPRMRSDLGALLLACATGHLAEASLEWTSEAAVGVVLAAGGYPAAYRRGLPITGLDEAGSIEGVSVFHSGTMRQDGRVVTAGGRVLTVSALGETLAEARTRAYGACARISFDGMQYRTDIAAEQKAAGQGGS